MTETLNANAPIFVYPLPFRSTNHNTTIRFEFKLVRRILCPNTFFLLLLYYLSDLVPDVTCMTSCHFRLLKNRFGHVVISFGTFICSINLVFLSLFTLFLKFHSPFVYSTVFWFFVSFFFFRYLLIIRFLFSIYFFPNPKLRFENWRLLFVHLFAELAKAISSLPWGNSFATSWLKNWLKPVHHYRGLRPSPLRGSSGVPPELHTTRDFVSGW